MDMSGKKPHETEQKQQPISEQAKEMGTAVKDKANEALAAAREKGKDLVDGGRKMMGEVEQKAGDAVAGVGGQVRKLAGTLRERLPHEGMVGSATESVAGTLESGFHAVEALTHLREMLTKISQHILILRPFARKYEGHFAAGGQRMFKVDAAAWRLGIVSKVPLDFDQVIRVTSAIRIEANYRAIRTLNRIQTREGLIHSDFSGEANTSLLRRQIRK